MTEKHTIWDSTLAEFRQRAAGAEQPTTGVSVAVISATLGAGLLQMVLELMAKRANFAGDVHQLSLLRRAAKDASEQLMLHADADNAAYQAYSEARRNKAGTDEMARCQRATIDVPLRAARGCLATLNLCTQAAGVVTGPITADLATAAILLESAVRSILRCISENLRHRPDEQVAVECAAMQVAAARFLNELALRPAHG